MKKIGILTQPLTTNYGGILQNYALQYILINKGYDVMTINRIVKVSDFKIGLSILKKKILKHHNVKFFFNREQKIISKNSERFISEYIKKVDVVNPNSNDLKKICTKESFDTLIVGSDQVWRPKYAINIYNDFFDFVKSNKNIRKIAYAASFGTTDWEFSKEQTNYCSFLAKKIDAISVREDSGLALCEKYLNVKAENVLDPTLLVDRSVYEEIISKNEQPIRKGMFIYVLDKSKQKEELISTISKALLLDVFSNQPAISSYNQEQNEDGDLSNFIYPSIEGWLQGFRDAEFVVTDSFHGTVFSIIFNKPFITIVNNDRGRARFESLLSKFGLVERLIELDSMVNLELLTKKIDFESVNDLKRELIVESMKFLEKNV